MVESVRPSSDAVPLHSAPLFETRDADEARAQVARVYCEHRLQLQHAPCVRHNRRVGQDIAINYMQYGTTARIAPRALETFYLFQFPLAGRAEIEHGAEVQVLGYGRAGILNPDISTDMTWSADCRQLMLQIDRNALQEFARTHLGQPATRTLQFRGTAEMGQGAGRVLRDLLAYVVAQEDGGAGMIGTGSLVGSQIEQSLLAALVEAVQHDAAPQSAALLGAPRAVRLAEAFMEENLAEPLTLQQISEAANVSPRTLQATFRVHRGRSPLEVLRDLRLARAHAALSNPMPETRVTDVAMDWGFFHLGRFSEQYRRVYGCTPVETLRATL